MERAKIEIELALICIRHKRNPAVAEVTYRHLFQATKALRPALSNSYSPPSKAV